MLHRKKTAAGNSVRRSLAAFLLNRISVIAFGRGADLYSSANFYKIISLFPREKELTFLPGFAIIIVAGNPCAAWKRVWFGTKRPWVIAYRMPM